MLYMNSVLLQSDVLVLGREYRVRERVVSGLIHTLEYRESFIWIYTYLRIQRELYLDLYILKNTERVVSGLIQTKVLLE